MRNYLVIGLVSCLLGMTSCSEKKQEVKHEIVENQKENRVGELRIDTVQSFTKVNDQLKEILKTSDVSDVLIVLDIDNTILTSTTDLGGDTWYHWQRMKLAEKPEEDEVVDCLFEDAIGLLYELGTMEYTDSIVPGLINDWQSQGVTLFALTSRDPRSRTATERELERNGVDLTKTAIRPEGEDLPVYRYMIDREMSYQKGIMMTTGMNKGEMLKHIIEKTGRSYSSILFVDDSYKNVINLTEAFKGGESDFYMFYYNKIEEERKELNGGAILTAEQADQMAEEWEELNETLKKIFPDRYKEGCGCLDQ